ncbi:uncharacterized protein LOC110845549 [Folsomia candida]|uniref:uncharacterized protein LOC110845549 n=1 Tax=Folsomia candida TaxID=158441 RepID=UPI000B9055AB|nr:uncharacterized protein LOC110845549 [Folsomia candida]
MLPNFFCHLFTGDDKTGVIPFGEPFPAIIEHSGYSQYLYGGSFILCPIMPHLTLRNTTKPYFLALSPIREKFDGRRILPVQKIQRRRTSRENVFNFQYHFAICVQPTYRYDSVLELMEWLEFHRMMGVTHVTMYNISMGAHQVHVNGQVAQSNDCLWRYRGVANYVLFLDFDEYLVPNYTHAVNYAQLVERLKTVPVDEKLNRSLPVAQFLFRSAFFGKDLAREFGTRRKLALPSTDSSEKLRLDDLITFTRTERQSFMYPAKVRSKFMSIPNQVIEPGVHYLERSEPRSLGEVQVSPEEIGFVHHYRDYLCGVRECSTLKKVTDNSAHFWVAGVLERTEELWKEVRKECNLGLEMLQS